MKFETGPFSFYGVMALSAPTLVAVPRPRLLSFKRFSLFSRLPGKTVSYDSLRHPAGRLTPTDFHSPSHISGLYPVQQYTPDFYVRALTDVQFVKITRDQYQNGLMTSRLYSTPQSEHNQRLHLPASLFLKPRSC
ncbi:metal transporter CNNM2-like isoform X1 [Gouania willdenowi]|nr:metal transporter CNNM2-like isoform X1 [Gouania willdenowi]